MEPMIRTTMIDPNVIVLGIDGDLEFATARLLASALNCTGATGQNPCGVCEHCVAIAQGRHIDVLEVEGFEELQEMQDLGTPISARYKIVICQVARDRSEFS
jgi:DNA polymerase III subunit gamma/tau